MNNASYISSLQPPRGLAFERPPFPRALVIMGATGSIGVSALDVIARHPDKFEVPALAGGRNAARLAEQAAAFRPPYLAVLDAQTARELQENLPAGYRPEILIGPEGYAALAALPEADMILSAQSGAAGLAATLSAVRAGKLVALANKESLVLAGELIRAECARSNAVLLPVDSEHNALFQALGPEPLSRVRKLILTASGGPFRGKKRGDLLAVTPETALKHPNWSMGAKISIDSATLMNKGLEVIEAHHLYGLPSEQIDVLVHPESIIHSLVEFNDTSMLAQLGPPDMRVAIAHCLAWPERIAPGPAPLDLLALGRLTFEDVDHATFPCLNLARSTLLPGGPSPVVLNAANEVAVAAFLTKHLTFLGIAELVRAALDQVTTPAPPQSQAEIMDLDERTRAWSHEWLRCKC